MQYAFWERRSFCMLNLIMCASERVMTRVSYLIEWLRAVLNKFDAKISAKWSRRLHRPNSRWWKFTMRIKRQCNHTGIIAIFWGLNNVQPDKAIVVSSMESKNYITYALISAVEWKESRNDQEGYLSLRKTCDLSTPNMRHEATDRVCTFLSLKRHRSFKHLVWRSNDPKSEND